MKYLIEATSFAAPFVSDTSTRLVEADTPEAALEAFAAAYTHPAGLFAANAYASAEAYHEGGEPVARWRSNHQQAMDRATKGKSSYAYRGNGPGDFEIDGERITVADPRGGSVIRA